MDVINKKKIEEVKELIGVANPSVGGTDTVMGMNKLLLNQLGNDDPAVGDRSSVMGYLKTVEDKIQPSIIRSVGLDVGGTNNNLTFSNNTMTPTNTPFAGYLLKSISRINLDRITFPKIYKPANTKCQVDVCGTSHAIFPTGSSFGLHFDGNTNDFIGTTTPESNTGTFDTTNKKFGTASISYDGSKYTQYADSTLWDVGSADFYVDFWVRRSETNLTVYYVFGQSDSTPNATSRCFDFSFSDTRLARFRCYVGSTLYECVSTTVFTDTVNFTHIRCGRDGSNIRIFINGVLEGTTAITGTLNNSTNKFCIGRLGEYNSSLFKGNIDEFLFVKNVSPGNSNFTPPIFPYGGAHPVSADSIMLAQGGSSINDFYKDYIAIVTSGTGAGQTRRIIAYDGTTRIATLNQSWTTLPAIDCNIELYDCIASDISPGFDFSTIDYTIYPTVNVICSLEKQTGATSSPSMGVPVVTSIEKDWESQAPVYFGHNASTYATAISVTGKVRLDNISVTSTGGSVGIRITRDGVVLFDGNVTPSSAGLSANMPFNLVCSASLMVELKSSGTTYVGCTVNHSK